MMKNAGTDMFYRATGLPVIAFGSFILFFRQGSFSKASNFSSSFRIVSSKKNLKQVWQGDSRGDREKQKHHFGSIYPLKDGFYISPTTEKKTTGSISSRNMASRQKSTRAYVYYNILHIYILYIHILHIYIII